MKKTLTTLFILAATLCGGGKANADAELRLYDGEYEWDLQDRIVILSKDGAAMDYRFKKECSAYSSCKSTRVNSDEDAKLAKLTAEELSALNQAITALSDQNPGSAKPAKPSLCKQFRRFVYEAKKESGSVIQVAQFKNCAGTRPSGPQAQVVEKILNLAAESAGL